MKENEQQADYRILAVGSRQDAPTSSSSTVLSILARLLKPIDHIQYDYIIAPFGVGNAMLRAVQHISYNLVIIEGHGNIDGFELPLSTPDLNDKLLRYLSGSGIYTISCYTARKFGRIAYQNYNAKYYIGYTDEEYVLLNSLDYDYLIDFQIVHLNEIIRLLRNISLSELINQTKNDWKRLSQQYILKGGIIAKMNSRSAIHNELYHVAIGDPLYREGLILTDEDIESIKEVWKECQGRKSMMLSSVFF